MLVINTQWGFVMGYVHGNIVIMNVQQCSCISFVFA